jgi:PKD repeat protein
MRLHCIFLLLLLFSIYSCLPEVPSFTCPKASFTVDKRTCASPDDCVIFIDNTSEGASKYEWDFGDGSTSTDPNPGKYSYKKPGLVTIRLIVENKNGCRDTSKTAVEVEDNGRSVAAFSIDNNACFFPCEVAFTNSSLAADTWAWDFGDGTRSELRNPPAKKYQMPGSYAVRLIASKSGKNSDTTFQEVRIRPITFTKTYREGIRREAATSVVEAAAGNGYFIAGNSFTGSEFVPRPFLLFVDKMGENKSYSDVPVGDWSFAAGLAQTDDGALYLSASGEQDFSLIRFEANGSYSRTKTFMPGILQSVVSPGFRAYYSSLLVTGTNELVFCGTRPNNDAASWDIHLLKSDLNGTASWGTPMPRFGGSDREIGYCVQKTFNNGLLLAGQTYTYGNAGDAFLIWTDGLGALLRQKNYGGDQVDCARWMAQTPGGEYWVCGYTDSYGPDRDVFLLKVDALGNELMRKNLGGPLDQEAFYITKAHEAGHYIVCGTSASPLNGSTDVLMVKIDEDGREIWKRTFGTAENEVAECVVATSDGGYLIAGNNNTSVLLVKTDKDGKVE